LREQEDMRRVAGLRDALEARIHAARPEALIFGRMRVCRIPPCRPCGVPAETQVMVLDSAGVAVSAGALPSGSSPSTVLRASWDVAISSAVAAIRVSLGWRSEAGDIDRFVGAWSGISVKESATRELAA
jgi:cysteine desulfurase